MAHAYSDSKEEKLSWVADLTDLQCKAASRIVSGKTTLIVGGPATGKTHVITLLILNKAVPPPIRTPIGLSHSALTAFAERVKEQKGWLWLDEVPAPDALRTFDLCCQDVRKNKKPFGGLQVVVTSNIPHGMTSSTFGLEDLGVFVFSAGERKRAEETIAQMSH